MLVYLGIWAVYAANVWEVAWLMSLRVRFFVFTEPLFDACLRGLFSEPCKLQDTLRLCFPGRHTQTYTDRTHTHTHTRVEYHMASGFIRKFLRTCSGPGVRTTLRGGSPDSTAIRSHSYISFILRFFRDLREGAPVFSGIYPREHPWV